MYKNPIISFAISTFNRSEKIFNLVNSILSHKGNEIEVVVLNNGSTDDTKKLLSNIQDDRLIVINYDINIGGILGPLYALLEAKGEYVFVCLDKDFIEAKQIKLLIDKLNDFKEQNVVFGKCVCNLDKIGPDKFFNNQFEILENLVFLAEHPTGLFFRTNKLKSLKIIDDIKSKYHDFGFNSELIKAELTNFGNALVLNVPIFSTEKIEDCKRTVSKTYNNKNLFFHPRLRKKELSIYIQSLNLLNLNVIENQKLLIKLYSNILFAATFDFKKILKNHSICEHYCIKPQNIYIFNLVYYNFSITKQFTIDIKDSKHRATIYLIVLNIQIKWFLKTIFNDFHGK